MDFVRHCCEWPCTWWGALSETDQATWFGAWSAAAAFLGGLAVYMHGKRHERQEEQRRRAISRAAQAAHIAGLLYATTEKLDRLKRWPESPPTSAVPLRIVEIPGIDRMRDAVTDPSAFDGNQAVEF